MWPYGGDGNGFGRPAGLGGPCSLIVAATRRDAEPVVVTIAYGPTAASGTDTGRLKVLAMAGDLRPSGEA